MDADLTKFLEAMEGRLREHANERAHDLRGYIDEHTQGLREYVDERTQGLREYIDERTRTLRDDIREYVDERWHDAETRIVRAFGAYQESAGVRMRKIEADVSNINASTTQQLDVLQSKLLDLETRIINLERP
jgi:hypothetical protein